MNELRRTLNEMSGISSTRTWLDKGTLWFSNVVSDGKKGKHSIDGRLKLVAGRRVCPIRMTLNIGIDNVTSQEVCTSIDVGETIDLGGWDKQDLASAKRLLPPLLNRNKDSIFLYFRDKISHQELSNEFIGV